ncbi:hypothetical protein HBI80_194240 [Parastagonospora nodorum]|nr:hypothetical protein HBH52_118470 [Parastagonospora nodorum]KAH4897354.1 hypothetical protein HBI80_194240 [Parastagonospora nodorum]KAH4950016.1 hypothetical protein HBH74_027050 [Parastagonospora nodorum]KAH4960337.1 hypothetical protein HBH73_076670 [Parastagonospora nodorum]KAH5028124.1 hypothetical protein HBI74_116940 [Parastagonospora nodorum]
MLQESLHTCRALAILEEVCAGDYPIEIKFPGWLCDHGEWITGYDQLCSGTSLPETSCAMKYNNAVEYFKQDWICRRCSLKHGTKRPQWLQYNSGSSIFCKRCAAPRGIGPGNNSIEFIICMKMHQPRDGSAAKRCRFTTRVGGMTHVDDDGKPLCRNNLCDNPMPFDGMDGSNDYKDKYALRLKNDIREQNTWLCKIDGEKNKKVEHCSFEGCGKHFVSHGIPIASY